MAITVKRMKNNRGVEVRTLCCGETFLYNNRVGVIAYFDGQSFPMDLITCTDFIKNNGKTMTGEEIVLPVDIEMSYKVVG